MIWSRKYTNPARTSVARIVSGLLLQLSGMACYFVSWLCFTAGIFSVAYVSLSAWGRAAFSAVLPTVFPQQHFTALCTLFAEFTNLKYLRSNETCRLICLILSYLTVRFSAQLWHACRHATPYVSCSRRISSTWSWSKMVLADELEFERSRTGMYLLLRWWGHETFPRNDAREAGQDWQDAHGADCHPAVLIKLRNCTRFQQSKEAWFRLANDTGIILCIDTHAYASDLVYNPLRI